MQDAQQTQGMRLGVFEHADPDAAAAGKYFFERDGKLEKETVGYLTKSTYQTLECETLAQLQEMLVAFGADWHLTAGIAAFDEATVLPREALDAMNGQAEGQPLISRTNEHLTFPDGGGLMVVDSDSADQQISFDEVWTALCSSVPTIALYACLQTTSSSSNVILGNATTGIGGLHSFFHVADALDIPRALTTLHERMILAGFGRHKLSKTGAFLARSFADQALRVPSQPVYLRAHVQDPVTQDKRFEMRAGVEVLDTRAVIPDMTAEERKTLNKMLADAEDALKPEMARVREDYVTQRVSQMAEAEGITTEAATAAINAAMSGQMLLAEFILYVGKEPVTVAEILSDPAKWHGKACCDPLEPDYNHGRSVAKIYSNQGQPLVHSFAHSGGDQGTKYKMTALPSVPTMPAPAPVPVPTMPEPAPVAYTILDQGQHMQTALLFCQVKYAGEHLAHWQDTFYRWTGPRWAECLPDEIKHELYLWMDTCFVQTKQGMAEAEPSTKWVNEVLLALRAATARDGRKAFGWKGEAQIPHVLAVENGLLCLDTLTLHPHTPDLFNVVSINAPWVPDGPAFETTEFGQWMAATVAKPDGSGADQLAMLQEATGYLVSGETRLQKIFLITGPRRSGKGTYGRLLTDLLGGAVSTISSSALQGSFPMQDLLGKSVAILPDVRIDRNTKQGQLAETLLSVSGEDHQTVARKFKTAWSGRLGVRFLMMSNSVPRLRDADGVLYSRFQFLEFPNSAYGREDPHLTERLWKDRAVMLKWAVDGFLRLRKSQKFTTSKTHHRLSEQALVRMDPIGCFVSEHLVVTGDQSHELPMADLHAVFHDFALGHNITTYTSVGFSKMFWAKDFPNVRAARGWRDVQGVRVRERVARGVQWRDASKWTQTVLATLRTEAREDENDSAFLAAPEGEMHD